MKKEGNILVVDDNRSILDSCKQLLKHDFGEIVPISSPNSIPSVIKAREIDVILLDMNFTASVNTGNEGIFWLREILKTDPGAVVIMMTAYGDIDLAVEAIREGAFFFIQKPWEPAKLIATIRSAIRYRKSSLEVKTLKRKQKWVNEQMGSPNNTIVGASKAISDCLSAIHKVAITDANVLLTGENGTGKELFAHEIHRCSSRSDEIFVTVDMGSIPSTLFESELFGHKRGSFTDAKEDRVGRIEMASGGTLFMDEIGNLPLMLQSRILSVIEQRSVMQVGSNSPTDVDIRLIAATNMNLQSMVADNLFREDLLYRLNTIEIDIPPLRDRGDDIILLTNYFLEKFSRQYNKEGLRISAKAYDSILSHSWPGNVRELKHSVERAVIMSERPILLPADFFNYPPQTNSRVETKIQTLASMEKELIGRALANNEMNISRAARSLEISRSTLYSKMKKYGL